MFLKDTISPLYTDLYQLTMAYSYYRQNMHQRRACFDYFFRQLPFKGGYVVFAGLSELANYLQELRFSEDDLYYLRHQGFDSKFLEYLKDFSFRGDIAGAREGDVIFPFEPVVRIEGNLVETQIIETFLLNQLNFQSLIATKAARIRYVSGNRHLSEFGLRRGQSFGAMHASRAAIIGGFDSTSNVLAAKRYSIPHAGTMSHSYIESFENEIDAFRAYAQSFPDQCVLLVDTYNTLYSGIPKAIEVALEMKKNGKNLKGIRLDSGDLAYLSRKAREMLDYDDLQQVKIVVSNQLDEYVIKSLIDQKAPIDIFGVGTSLVTGQPDAALDGVYKLAQVEDTPVLKISDNLQKTTLPGKKKILRYFDREGMFYGDAILLQDETGIDYMVHPFEKFKSTKLQDFACEDLYVTYMKGGKLLIQPENPLDLNKRLRTRLNLLPAEHQRFDYPHIYKVGISEKLVTLRDNILRKHTRI